MICTETKSRLQASLETILDLHQAIDFRRIGFGGSRDRQFTSIASTMHSCTVPTLAASFASEIAACHVHETRQAFLPHVLRHRIGQRIRCCAFHRRIGERTDAIELRFLEEVQQFLNSASVSPGNPTMKVERMAKVPGRCPSSGGCAPASCRSHRAASSA